MSPDLQKTAPIFLGQLLLISLSSTFFELLLLSFSGASPPAVGRVLSLNLFLRDLVQWEVIFQIIYLLHHTALNRSLLLFFQQKHRTLPQILWPRPAQVWHHTLNMNFWILQQNFLYWKQHLKEILAAMFLGAIMGQSLSPWFIAIGPEESSDALRMNCSRALLGAFILPNILMIMRYLRTLLHLSIVYVQSQLCVDPKSVIARNVVLTDGLLFSGLSLLTKRLPLNNHHACTTFLSFIIHAELLFLSQNWHSSLSFFVLPGLIALSWGLLYYNLLSALCLQYLELREQFYLIKKLVISV